MTSVEGSKYSGSCKCLKSKLFHNPNLGIVGVNVCGHEGFLFAQNHPDPRTIAGCCSPSPYHGRRERRTGNTTLLLK